MYFVSYTTNKYAGPKIGWNIWKVKPAPKSYSVGPSSFKILKIIIGGSKRPDAKNVSVMDINRYIVDNKRDVFERIFNL